MKYFTIEELCRSSRASAAGIDNTCGASEQHCLEELVENILDPLRKAYGKPIRVNSGYRCGELNRLIGGVPTSQHLLGQAADITGGSKAENKKLFELVQNLKLPFDQLINESNYSWVHVSYGPRNRRQILNL